MTAALTPEAAPERPAGTTTSTVRRDHLDGLRAVAVYLVVIFHAGSLRFSGGFIGVDVFFVLSGYLVTQVLLRDLETDGSIRFGRFYARRVRRLLPASLIALTVSAVVYAALATPAQIADATRAFQSAYLYVANWYFIHQTTDYFATDVARSPVLHMWSLAVEEQFYLLWPLLFAGLLRISARFGAHRRQALRAAIALGAAASTGWALALRTDQPERAYFGTDARAYQLLAGALLALTPALFTHATRHRLLTRLAVPAGLLAVLALAIAFDRLDPIERGIAVTAVTCALIVALDADVPGAAKRLLSWSPVVYFGRVSYGTYLWHWPVVLVIGELVELDPKPLAALVALIATGLASLSYQVVEWPVRLSVVLDRRAKAVVAAGLTLSVVAASAVVPRVLDRSPDPAAAAAAPTSGFTPVPPQPELDAVQQAKFGTTVDCVGKAAEACTVVEGSGRHLLLMGDSNAQMWIPAFTEMARTRDLTLSLAVTSGCPWQREVYVLSQAIRDQCRRTKVDAYDRVIPALDPDLIVVVGAGQGTVEMPDDERARGLQRATEASLRELGTHTEHLLVIESAPRPPDGTFSPLACLARSAWVESCRFVARPGPDWIEQLERDLAESSDQVSTADLDRLICPFLPICDPIVGGTVVFWNGEHLSAGYSRSLAPELGAYLEGQRLID